MNSSCVKNWYCQFGMMIILVIISMNAFSATNQICLAGICINNRATVEEAVVKILGRGVRTLRPEDSGPSLCYFSPKSGLWGEFTFEHDETRGGSRYVRGIMLTRHKLCDPKMAETKFDFGTMLDRITISDSEEELLDKRGTPDRIDDAVTRENEDRRIKGTRYSSIFGTEVYVYDSPEDILFTFAFIKDKQVYTIWSYGGP